MAKKIASWKCKGVFLKLDISRAFDSLSWPFLFEVLKAKGFGQRMITWLSILLQIASTRILVNGTPGRSIIHAQGLKQGDPISPLLFVVTMDALTTTVTRASEVGVLNFFRGISAAQRISIYDDDVAFFIRPTLQDLLFVREALLVFGSASGLKVNYAKSTTTVIRGN